jgi:hypothetical protein
MQGGNRVKRKKLRRLIEDVLAQSRVHNEPVTFRVLEIHFRQKRVVIDGRIIECDADVLSMPILEGSAVFMAKGAERVA